MMSRNLWILGLIGVGCGGEVGDTAPNTSQIDEVVIRQAGSDSTLNLLEMSPGESATLRAYVKVPGGGNAAVTVEAEWLISDPKRLTGTLDTVAETWEVSVPADVEPYVEEEPAEVTVSVAWNHVTNDPPLIVRITVP